MENVAAPAIKGAVPSIVAPSVNATLPVKPVAPEVTVAVNVTDAPPAAGFAFEASLVTVAALSTSNIVAPDVIVLVADAGLGTINAVRLTLHALGPLAALAVVVLNRFDPKSDLHRRNLEWVSRRDGRRVVTIAGSAAGLVDFVRG